MDAKGINHDFKFTKKKKHLRNHNTFRLSYFSLRLMVGETVRWLHGLPSLLDIRPSNHGKSLLDVGKASDVQTFPAS